MSPEERQMLTGLFDRIRGAAATPRDPEAEALISDAVRNMPYAPYLLAQAVIVQDQALQAANGKLQEQEAQLHELEQQIEQQQPRQSTGGGFLGGLGSIFGSHPAPEPPASSVPPSGPWGQQAQQPSYRQPHEPPPSGNPWAGAPGMGGSMGGGMGGSMGAGMGSPTMGGPGMSGSGMGAPMGGGGGFLKGALGAAAGVAGGVLLADSIRGLFGAHNNPLGISTGMGGLGSGLGGLGSGLGTGSGGETTINNYYDSPSSDADNAQDQDGTQEASYDDDDNDDNDDNYGDDDSSDDGDNGDDGSYDV